MKITAIPPETEKHFAQAVVEAAHFHGWRVYRTWNSIHSPKGFPDLTMVHAGKRRIIFAELKTNTGKCSSAQSAWLFELSMAHREVYLWRPSQWDEIIETLKGEV